MDKIEQFGIISHNLCDKVEDLCKFTTDMYSSASKKHIAEATELSYDKLRKEDENVDKRLETMAVIAMAGYSLHTGVEPNKIANLMTDTYKRKNADYGNSFDESLDFYGVVGGLIRIGDKVNRIKSLVLKNKDAEVKDESIADTYLDLANYSIMTWLWIKEQEEKE